MEKKRDPEQPFLSFTRWLSKWTNSEVILSHTKKPVTRLPTALAQFYFGCIYYGSQNDQYSIPAKSGCGLINAEALLGGDTALAHINYNHRSRHY